MYAQVQQLRLIDDWFFAGNINKEIFYLIIGDDLIIGDKLIAIA